MEPTIRRCEHRKEHMLESVTGLVEGRVEIERIDRVIQKGSSRPCLAISPITINAWENSVFQVRGIPATPAITKLFCILSIAWHTG